MGPFNPSKSSSDLIEQVAKELRSQIRKTYLDEEDIKQEANVALIVSKIDNKDLASSIKKHLSTVLARSPTEATEPRLSLYQTHEPIEYIIQLESKKKLLFVLQSLLDRCTLQQKIIIRLIYGLLDGKCRDYNEISLMFKLPVKKIKEIEKEALYTLRHMNGLSYLRSRFF